MKRRGPFRFSMVVGLSIHSQTEIIRRVPIDLPRESCHSVALSYGHPFVLNDPTHGDFHRRPVARLVPIPDFLFVLCAHMP